MYLKGDIDKLFLNIEKLETPPNVIILSET